jgi:hypothetical protein
MYTIYIYIHTHTHIYIYISARQTLYHLSLAFSLFFHSYTGVINLDDMYLLKDSSVPITVLGMYDTTVN